MNTNQNAVGWGFWLRWVLASLLGFAMGGVLGGVALDALAFGEGFAGMIVFGAIFGAAGGMMQWLVLRRNVNQTGGWVLATAIGCTLAGIATELGFRRLPFSEALIAAMIAFAAVAGVAGGILQWLVLHRRVARAGWWVLTSTVGLTVGMRIGGPIAITLAQAGSPIEASIVLGVLFGLGVGPSQGPPCCGSCGNLSQAQAQMQLYKLQSNSPIMASQGDHMMARHRYSERGIEMNYIKFVSVMMLVLMLAFGIGGASALEPASAPPGNPGNSGVIRFDPVSGCAPRSSHGRPVWDGIGQCVPTDTGNFTMALGRWSITTYAFR